MKIRILIVSVFMAGAIFLLNVQYQFRRLKWECPAEVKAATGINLPFDRIPALEAILEISGNGTSILPQNIGVQLVPKQAGRPNSPLLIQLAPIQLPDIQAGTYNFKVTLRRLSDHLPLATIDTIANIQPGSSVSFDQEKWNYDLEEESAPTDGFNNITEIMSGHFEVSGGGAVPNLWVSHTIEQSDPADPTRHPVAMLLRPYAISVSSPGAGGAIRVVGDPFSVQSGVNVIATLYTSNGSEKSKVNAYSRLDGSFDLPTFSNAVVGDKVRVYVTSRNEVGAPTSLSDQNNGKPNRELELLVKDLQSCQ